MSQRTRHLVAYDIREDRRLRRVAKTLHGYGSRLQYSVFICDLSHPELCDLRFDLAAIVEPVDSVVIIPLGKGYDLSAFEFIGPHPPLPQAGSVIV